MNPKAQLLVSRFNTVVALYWFGAFYGFSALGMPKMQAMVADQKKDPNLARFVAIREEWASSKLGAVRELQKAREKARDQRMAQRTEGEARDGAQQESDPQSLGGVDFYGADSNSSTPKTEEGRPSSYQTPLSYQRPSSQQSPSSASVDKNDPFSIVGDSHEAQSNANESQSGQQSGGLSTWERIRRGEKPAPQKQSEKTSEETPSRVNSWRQRAQSKQDSFTFSSNDSEKEMAKIEAQKDFDQRVERERRGEGLNGFAPDSSEGRGRGRGAW